MVEYDPVTDVEHEYVERLIEERDCLREEVKKLKRRRVDDALFWWAGIALVGLLCWAFDLLHF